MTTIYKDGFKVGDRVIIDGVRIGNAHRANGKHGTIMSLEKGYYGKNIFAVELDEPMYNHDCFGQTKPGHGYYAYTEELRHEQPTRQP